MISLNHRQEWILILLSYEATDGSYSAIGSMTAGDILDAFQCLYAGADSAFANLKDLFAELKLLVNQELIVRLWHQVESEQTLEEYYQITDLGVNALIQCRAFRVNLNCYCKISD